MAGMVVGLVVGLIQALTQIQEQTVAFVPKLIAMVLALGLSLPWVLTRLIEYSRELIANIPELAVRCREPSGTSRTRPSPPRLGGPTTYARNISRQPVHGLHAGARADRRAGDDGADLRHAGVAAAGAGAAGRGDVAAGDAGVSRARRCRRSTNWPSMAGCWRTKRWSACCSGSGMNILFSGIQVAGQIVSQMSGLSLADVFNPGFEEDVSVFSQLFYFLTLAVFVAVGGHRIVTEALLETFAGAPPGHAALGDNFVEVLTEHRHAKLRAGHSRGGAAAGGAVAVEPRARPDQPHAAADQRHRRRLRRQFAAGDGHCCFLSLGAVAWTFQEPTIDVLQQLREAIVASR